MIRWDRDYLKEHRERFLPKDNDVYNLPAPIDTQPFQVTWLPQADGGRMIGDYFSTSFAGDRVVPVFGLALPPLRGRFREGIFAASLRTLG